MTFFVIDSKNTPQLQNDAFASEDLTASIELAKKLHRSTLETYSVLDYDRNNEVVFSTEKMGKLRLVR